jgi:hypothetical protein
MPFMAEKTDADGPRAADNSPHSMLVLDGFHGV